jgi:hypothetical protein
MVEEHYVHVWSITMKPVTMYNLIYANLKSLKNKMWSKTMTSTIISMLTWGWFHSKPTWVQAAFIFIKEKNRNPQSESKNKNKIPVAKVHTFHILSFSVECVHILCVKSEGVNGICILCSKIWIIIFTYFCIFFLT